MASIYVGDFDKSALSLSTPRRLSYTEAFDNPMDWTADGKAVILCRTAMVTGASTNRG